MLLVAGNDKPEIHSNKNSTSCSNAREDPTLYYTVYKTASVIIITVQLSVYIYFPKVIYTLLYCICHLTHWLYVCLLNIPISSNWYRATGIVHVHFSFIHYILVKIFCTKVTMLRGQHYHLAGSTVVQLVTH